MSIFLSTHVQSIRRMFMLKSLIFSFFVCMVTTNPGACPFYPRVPERDKSCYMQPNCLLDSDCKYYEKCCENPCGISLCSDNINPDPRSKMEKCPQLKLEEPPSCKHKQTIFCYITECKRCCIHVTSCNPAPKLLTDPKNCYAEICKEHSCPQQGAICYVDEIANKPNCKCKTSCDKRRAYVCASFQNAFVTFRNRCYMNKTACETKKTYRVVNEGRCV